MKQNARVALMLLGVLASAGMFTSWLLHLWVFSAEEFCVAWAMWPFGIAQLIIGIDGLRRAR